MTILFNKAREIAFRAHQNQYRFNGMTPYIVHPLRVAEKFEADFFKAVAVMHDVLEDNPEFEDEMTTAFKSRLSVVTNVMELTKKKKEDYFDYIKRIKQNSFCIIEIKIADIIDNLSDAPTEKQCNKYKKALEMLIMK